MRESAKWIDKMQKAQIPTGMYCYTYDQDGHSKLCPYWGIRDDKPEQENGYCAFLGKGDWDFDQLSLIWDQVKECGINDEDEQW